jgi:phospholipid/cholesterol/gamma-HCH transport system substrate-binding protein
VLVVAVAAVTILLVSSHSSYVLHARFYDAGQLVGGDLVTVGGHQVGSVGQVTLVGHGMADVALNITDRSLTPLRRGTIATIGQTSLTGVANRFVGITPGSGPPLPSGSILSPEQTRGIVDLDTLLDTLTPRVRTSLESLLRTGAYTVSQPTASQFNRGLLYSNSALTESTQLEAALVANRSALSGLISSSAQLTHALAAHSQQLGGAVHETAAVLREIATQRSALADSISRAPAVLAQSTRVLGHLGGTLRVLDPVLVHLRPAAVRLGTLLRAVLPAAANAIPTLQALQRLVPGAEAALEAFPAVERVATPAVNSLTTLLRVISPSLSSLRPFTSDVVGGFFNGVGGATAGTYDANGHYLHGLATIQGGGASLTGLLNLLLGHPGTLGPFGGERTGLLSPCPGGGGPPAADRSNPWNFPDILPGAPTVCKPSNNQR